MSKYKKLLLLGTAISSLAHLSIANKALAEDCTGTLPGANCTLDENTTAPLTIDNGVTLTIDSSVTLGHEINGSAVAGDGTIETVNPGNTITQNADIGRTTQIESLTIADDNVWTTSAGIFTDNDGSDIDLGAADGSETLNFISGGGFAGEIDGHSGDIVNFGSDGNGGTYITGGQIEAVHVYVTSGDLSIINRSGSGTPLGGLDIASGATLTTYADVTIGGTLVNDGTITIGAGDTLSSDLYSADINSGRFILQVGRATGTTSVGSLAIGSGGPVDFSNDVFEILLSNSSSVLSPEIISNVIVGNTGPTIAPGSFLDNSYLYNFSLLPNGNNYDLSITLNPLDELTTTSNNRNIANTILVGLRDSESASVNTVQSILGNASNSADFNEALESLSPTVDGGYVEASLEVMGNSQDFVRSRIKSRLNPTDLKSRYKSFGSGSKNLVTNRTTKGVDTKNSRGSGNVWARGFASSTTQETRDRINGYDMTTQGVAIGADTGNMDRDMIYGFALTAGQSKIDSANANNASTDVESYGFTLYAGRKVLDDAVLGTSISYIHDKNITKRYNVGGVLGVNTEAGYATEHMGLEANLSKQYKMQDGMLITPSITTNFDYISADKYNESGSSDLKLSVDNDELYIVSIGGGAELEWPQRMEGYTFVPIAGANLSYDLLNDGVSATANFAAAEDKKFAVEGFTPQRAEFDSHIGFIVKGDNGWNVSAQYNLTYKQDLIRHSGIVDAAYKF